MKCFTEVIFHSNYSKNNDDSILDSSHMVNILEILGLRTPNISSIILQQRPPEYKIFTTNDDADNDADHNIRNNTNHKIPHILIFTHHINLLTTNLDLYDDNDEKKYRQQHRRRRQLSEMNQMKSSSSSSTFTVNSNSSNNINSMNEIEVHNNNDTVVDPYRYTKPMLNELRALQQNVHRIIALHTSLDNDNDDMNQNTNDDTTIIPRKSYSNNKNSNGTSVRFLTDDDCIYSIRQWAHLSQNQNHTIFMHQTNVPNLHPKYNHNIDPDEIANELISYFQNEPEGMYKADICRGVALYETGGVYMDVDLGTRMNVFTLFLQHSEFITVHGTMERNYPGNFFQAFIAVTPFHDVIHRYIQLFILYYRHTIQIGTNDLIGVTLLKRAYDEIQVEQELMLQYNQLQQQHQQKYDDNTATSMSTTKENESSLSTTAFITHLQQTTELWQEILYKRHYQYNILSHVPRPTWGNVRLICKFIVVIPPSIPQQQSLAATTTTTTTMSNINYFRTKKYSKLIVPMYSRIADSRLCPK
jgi:hypothetical protein